MKRVVAKKYLEKAEKLTRDEAELFFSRMDKKLARRLEENKLPPTHALAIQLEIEDEKLQEWRMKFTGSKAHSDK